MGQYGAAADSGGLRTKPETVQQITASLYSNYSDSPVLGGYEITGRADLSFNVSAGSAVHSQGTGRATYVCSDAAQTALITPPVSGTQTWIVYVDSDGQVNVGTNPEAPFVTLGQYDVPAGCTATSSLTNTWNTNYALPYGATLPPLFDGTDRSNWAAGGDFIVVSGAFYVPTDRRICLEITTSLMAVQAGTGNAVSQGSAYQRIVLDGSRIREMERQISGVAESTEQYREYATVSKGTHTVSLGLRDGVTGYKRFYSDGGWPGQRLTVLDLGVAQ